MEYYNIRKALAKRHLANLERRFDRHAWGEIYRAYYERLDEPMGSLRNIPNHEIWFWRNTIDSNWCVDHGIGLASYDD